MSYSQNSRLYQQRSTRRERTTVAEQGFVCLHCQLYVACDPAIAGVQNRNHCPYCLWSRHLDWRTPGDRLSNCRVVMQPIGLTTRRSRNKYAHERDGELMLIHRCCGCTKPVINRIAADDGVAELLALFEQSYTLDAATRAELERSGVVMLTEQDYELVRRRLLGNRPLR